MDLRGGQREEREKVQLPGKEPTTWDFRLLACNHHSALNPIQLLLQQDLCSWHQTAPPLLWARCPRTPTPVSLPRPAGAALRVLRSCVHVTWLHSASSWSQPAAAAALWWCPRSPLVLPLPQIARARRPTTQARHRRARAAPTSRYARQHPREMIQVSTSRSCCVHDGTPFPRFGRRQQSQPLLAAACHKPARGKLAPQLGHVCTWTGIV